MQKFKIVGKLFLLKSKWKERKKNNAKFRGHYVCQHTHNVRAHALRSDQKLFRGWGVSGKHGETGQHALTCSNSML